MCNRGMKIDMRLGRPVEAANASIQESPGYARPGLSRFAINLRNIFGILMPGGVYLAASESAL
jgi:hypothetical protein